MVKSSKLLLSPNGSRCVALFEVLGIYVTKKRQGACPQKSSAFCGNWFIYNSVLCCCMETVGKNPGWSKVEHLGGCGHRPGEKCQWLGLER